MTSKKTGATASLYIMLVERSINTMNAIRRKSESIKRWLAKALAPDTSHLPDLNVFIAASEGNVMNTGKRYRKTSGHSPFFSLYTFFGLR